MTGGDYKEHEYASFIFIHLHTNVYTYILIDMFFNVSREI
jgi:hypothetical protein